MPNNPTEPMNFEEEWDGVIYAALAPWTDAKKQEYLSARKTAILSAHTPALEQGKREARIEELESVLRIAQHDNMSPDGSGIDDWCKKRLAELSAIQAITPSNQEETNATAQD